ncbi:MAG: hypothetical protein ABSF79_05970 [Smithellaceae bacterium]|jgi:hypothetical protein
MLKYIHCRKKPNGFFKTLICCVALQTAPLNVYPYTPRGSLFLRALHLNIFEQPKTWGFSTTPMLVIISEKRRFDK